MIRHAAAAAAVTVVFAGCGVSQADRTSTPAPAAVAHDPCGHVNVAATSSLVPTDWDVWCDSFLDTGVVWADQTAADKDGACFYWSVTSDADLLSELRADGFRRDEAIGFIDFLWTVC